MKLLQLLFLVLMALQLMPAVHQTIANGELYPIILIPGSGGNQLEARLTDDYKPSSFICYLSSKEKKKKDGWFRLWFDPSVLIPPFTRCFAERMQLYYDAHVDDYKNAPGVITRVPYFGSTDGMLYLDPNLKSITNYMATLVSSLKQLGYMEGSTLFGAPYDFRYGLAASGHPSKVGTQYLQDLKTLIESTSSSNAGKPVILLSHSLGGLFALHLLNKNQPSWCNQYIKQLLTLSAPWAGTVQEMLTYASGYTLGIPIVNHLLVREEQRSSESNMWLLPSPRVFKDKPLVVYTMSKSRNKSYSALDMQEFLEDVGYKEGVYPYKTRVLPLVSERFEMPQVPVTCIVGSGVDTPEILMYGDEGFDVQPKVVYGNGDGTVNRVSLMALQSEFEEVKVIELPGVSHTSILKDENALKVIAGEICSLNSVCTN